MLNKKGEGEYAGIWYAFAILALGYWSVRGLTGLMGGEQEGVVKYDDCREVVMLNEDSIDKYFHKFTCTYNKDYNGNKIGGAECVSVETADNNTCRKAYVYEKK